MTNETLQISNMNPASYVQTLCRVCQKTILGKKYSLHLIYEIMRNAYSDVQHSENRSEKVCYQCYQCLRRWNNDRMKFTQYKRKNPNSKKAFSTGRKLPPFFDDEVIHLQDECPCEGKRDIFLS